MVKTILACAVLVLGAKFVEYEQWFSAEKEQGRHYVLVSAEWCRPCGELKKRLSQDKYNDAKIIIMDIDKHPEASKKVLKGRGVPTLIEYNLSGNEWKPARIWDGVDLDKFLNGE